MSRNTALKPYYPGMLSPNTDNLWEYGIYRIPANECGGRAILYAPLSGYALSASDSFIRQVCDCVLSDDFRGGVDAVCSAADALLSKPLPTDEYVESLLCAANLNRLAILPTGRCNFSCSYCYAAKGRSRATLDRADVDTSIDAFLDPARASKRNVYITILGGGEPLLEKEIVLHALEYSAALAAERDFKVRYGLTSNGSILDEEVVAAISKHNVDLGISYEILEDVQNRERGHYNRVTAVISGLIERGVVPEVKAIIKKDNFSRIGEMVSQIHARFPAIVKVKLQPIDSETYFSGVEDLRAFYDAFFREFTGNLDLARAKGIELYCTMSGFGLSLKNHYCGGEICLTPSGRVSICHRFSAVGDDHYDEALIGGIENSHMVLDEKKYAALMKRFSLLDPRCRRCVARFHCSGGCIAQGLIYKQDFREEVCRFNRNLISYLLRRKLEKAPNKKPVRID